jgi:hypothetical protein
MIKVTIETDDMSFTIKDKNAEGKDDCLTLLTVAMDNAFGGVGMLYLDEEDTSIYIEQNQPKDHIQHEGM